MENKAPKNLQLDDPLFIKAHWQKLLLTWYESQKKPYPWRTNWEKHKDPYHVWISEIMLQQTLIKTVLQKYEDFLEQFPTIDSVAQASEEDIKLAIRGLGYYRRFNNFHKACKILQATPKDSYPKTFEEWKTLPGIGDYTASAIASITAKEPYLALDGNLKRVLSRLFYLKGLSEIELFNKLKAQEKALIRVVHPGDLNQALMELGQSHCSITKPQCSLCPLKKHCKSFFNQDFFVIQKPKQNFESVALKLQILKSKDHYILFERSKSSKFLKGSFGFLTFLKNEDDENFYSDGFKDLSFKYQSSKFLKKTFKHSITRFKITGHVEEILLNLDKKKITTFGNVKYLKASEVEGQLVSNLDRKAWKIYQFSFPDPVLLIEM